MPGSSEAPDQGEIALEVWLDQLFFRRGDRTGEPASLLIHRGPTLTRVPEKWIRWLVNRGEGFFEAGTRRQIGHVAEEAPQDTVNMVERMKVARCVSS